uniref:G-protein coupled receptors family 2 profile 1 domain-containing protein n=1 Tax=Laticauda laticaudata TaxID=8630 RepID=A0A8C5SP35_LATLA
PLQAGGQKRNCTWGKSGPSCRATIDQIGTCWPRSSGGDLVERPCPEYTGTLPKCSSSFGGFVPFLRVGSWRELSPKSRISTQVIFPILISPHPPIHPGLAYYELGSLQVDGVELKICLCVLCARLILPYLEFLSPAQANELVKRAPSFAILFLW